jgi:transcriptional antiterminator RfaH
MEAWYVVFTKPKQEQVAEENLQRQGIETYLPKVQRRLRRGNRAAYCIEPLFPRYLFINMDVQVQSTASIRSTRGAVNLVAFGAGPVTVAAELISKLKQSADPDLGVHLPVPPKFTAGQKVNILDGPFQDITGTFCALDGESRAMILLDLLGRKNRVCVDTDRLVMAG